MIKQIKRTAFSAILLCGSQLTMAAPFPLASVTDFTGEYNTPSGSASASTFVYADYDFGENPEFSVEKQAGALFLKAADEEFQIDNLPSMFEDLNVASWSGVSLTSDGEKVGFVLKKLQGDAEASKLYLSNFKVNCDNSGSDGELMEQLLDSCLNNKGKVRIGLLKSTDKEKNKTTSISSLYLSVDGDKLYFSMKQGVTVKGYGRVFYEGDKIRIKVNKVKAGFLNVTNKFWGEIKKAESESIILNRPWIEILLKE